MQNVKLQGSEVQIYKYVFVTVQLYFFYEHHFTEGKVLYIYNIHKNAQNVVIK